MEPVLSLVEPWYRWSLGTTLTYHKYLQVMNLSYFTIERVFASRIIHFGSFKFTKPVRAGSHIAIEMVQISEMNSDILSNL